MTIQLDLFDMAAADAQAERETHDIPSLFNFDSADLADYDRVFLEWKTQWGNFNCIAISHAWRFVTDVLSPLPAPGCQPVVMRAQTGCHHHHWTETCMCVGQHTSPFRARCRGCTWRSELVATETEAVFAGLDHTHPGWRQSPVVSPRPHDNPKKQQRWDTAVANLYGNRPEGWPIITDRDHRGARAVPSRSPWGGYDVAAHSLAHTA